jgi:N-dimethylarginine dimethylaminohydrolase
MQYPDSRGTTFVLSTLRCPQIHGEPDGCHYRVAWSINPHMKVGAADFGRATRQAAALRAALTKEGAALVEVPFVHGAYDSVFTKDAALLVRRGGRRRALLARQRFEVRALERDARASVLADLGFEVSDVASAVWEGGDVVIGDECALLGFGPRSDRAAADWLARELDMPVLSLELVDPRLFHLDMAMSRLPGGKLLVCEEALAPASMRVLRAELRRHDIVPVAMADALAFGLNLVPVGDAVVVGARVPGVEQTLRTLGLRPVIVPLGEFHLAGGSAACLVARVHDELADAMPSATHSAVA